MDGKFISYLRVSTKKQGVSGLGLDAQKSTIETFLNGGNWKVLKEYTEVESGKNAERPVLLQAIAHAKRTNATLLIAKLDRLARNVAFVSALMESGVNFLCCDNPHANKLTIHILASIAEYERDLISKRTKDALAEAKKRGVVLGSPKHLTPEAIRNGVERSKKVRILNADRFAQDIYAVIKEDVDAGVSLVKIADRLNRDGFLTARNTKWYPMTVRNLISRTTRNVA